MFERFSEGARRVVVLAQEESSRLGHGHIGDEHLLVGLADQQESLAARVLGEVGVDAARLRGRLGPTGRDRKHHSGHIPFTPVAKKVLEGAMREAMASNAREIGTEHLLIALTRVNGAGVDVLRQLEVDVDELRDRTVRAATANGETTVEETQATPWSTPRADVETQLAGIESTLHQILARLAAIEGRLPEK